MVSALLLPCGPSTTTRNTPTLVSTMRADTSAVRALMPSTRSFNVVAPAARATVSVLPLPILIVTDAGAAVV